MMWSYRVLHITAESISSWAGEEGINTCTGKKRTPYTQSRRSKVHRNEKKKKRKKNMYTKDKKKKKDIF